MYLERGCESREQVAGRVEPLGVGARAGAGVSCRRGRLAHDEGGGRVRRTWFTVMSSSPRMSAPQIE